MMGDIIVYCQYEGGYLRKVDISTTNEVGLKDDYLSTNPLNRFWAFTISPNHEVFAYVTVL